MATAVAGSCFMTADIYNASSRRAPFFLLLALIWSLGGPLRLIDASIDDIETSDAAASADAPVDMAGAGEDAEWVPATSWEASGGLAAALLEEVEAALGRGSGPRADFEERLKVLTEDMRQLFAVMPKNEYGLLGHTAVRYALHRFFVRRHAWFVEGLATHGDAWNASSPTDLLKGHVSDRVRGLFEIRLQRGFDIDGLALMAGTFEFLVQSEAEVRLGAVYKVHGVAMDRLVSANTAEALLFTYMGTLILLMDVPTVRRQPRLRLPSLLDSFRQSYPNYVELMRIINEARSTVQRDPSAVFSFHNVSAVLREVGERYDHWSGHAECEDLKQLLLKAEEHDTGCVRLSSFYGNSTALKDAWQFQESPEWLRQLGALDDSETDNPHVIVSNYIQGASNCLASSSFYSLCCVNECEPLFRHIEETVNAPEVEPARLAAIISAMPSGSVKAPRTLAPGLVFHLHEIAWKHNGAVPLHGRLFAQWMHHAYPRECQYPHVAGTTFPQFRGAVVTLDERRALGVAMGARSHVAQSIDGTCTPWGSAEELLIEARPSTPSMGELEQDTHLWTCFQTVWILIALICVLLKTASSALAVKRTIASQKAPNLRCS